MNLETAIEIVAKKMWHRGAAAKARDLFDLCLMIERDAKGLRGAAPFLVRHRDAFIRQINERADILKVQFDAIDALDYRPDFETCAKRAEAFLRALPETGTS